MLQVLAHAYDRSMRNDGAPTVTVLLPFSDVGQAQSFVDKWYLNAKDPLDAKSHEHRGVVDAAAGAADLFVVRKFPPDNDVDELSKALDGAKNKADVATAVDSLQKYDFLQVWLPSTAAGAQQMAHTALYVGYAFHAPANASQNRTVYVRLYYWSSHYENMPLDAVPVALSDVNKILVDNIDDVKKAVVTFDRRVGYSYVDVRTGWQVVNDAKLPGALALRPATSVYAMSLKTK